MSLEKRQRLIQLRAMAHPVRLRILSLTTGAALSAADIAAELGIAHAAASYHLRQLVEAGLLSEEAAPKAEVRGRGRPPTRYRHLVTAYDRPDRADEDVALWAAMSEDVQRRLRLRSRYRVAADAEVWLEPTEMERVSALAEEISQIIHTRAQPPHADQATRASVSVFVFELGETR